MVHEHTAPVAIDKPVPLGMHLPETKILKLQLDTFVYFEERYKDKSY